MQSFSGRRPRALFQAIAGPRPVLLAGSQRRQRRTDEPDLPREVFVTQPFYTTQREREPRLVEEVADARARAAPDVARVSAGGELRHAAFEEVCALGAEHAHETRVFFGAY